MSLFDAKTMKNQEITRLDKRENERGSVIVWILLMVVLLAALTFTFSQGFRAGEGSISREKSDLYATEILDYAQNVKQAVQTLQISGCNDTEISFDNPIVTGYNFPSTPSDGSCEVFNPNGGGLRYAPLEDEVFASAPSYTAAYYHSEWAFTANHCVMGLGDCDNKAHLMMFIAPLSLRICESINNKINIDAPIPLENLNLSKGNSDQFLGVYGDAIIDNIRQIDVSGLNGQMHGCFQDNAGATQDAYIFYQTLLVR